MLWLMSRPLNHREVSNERSLILRAKQPGVSRCLENMLSSSNTTFDFGVPTLRLVMRHR